jgi:hypothetical protein
LVTSRVADARNIIDAIENDGTGDCLIAGVVASIIISIVAVTGVVISTGDVVGISACNITDSIVGSCNVAGGVVDACNIVGGIIDASNVTSIFTSIVIGTCYINEKMSGTCCAVVVLVVVVVISSVVDVFGENSTLGKTVFI